MLKYRNVKNCLKGWCRNNEKDISYDINIFYYANVFGNLA